MSSIQYVIGALHKPLNDHYNFYWRILEKSGPEKVSKGGRDIFCDYNSYTTAPRQKT